MTDLAQLQSQILSDIAAAGDEAALEIYQRLQATATVPDREALVGRLIRQLDSDAYPLREEASAALKDLGAAIEPTLRAALMQPNLPQEAHTRIDALLTDFAAQQNGTPAERRARRLVEVLELIGTPDARRTLAEVADQRKASPAHLSRSGPPRKMPN